MIFLPLALRLKMKLNKYVKLSPSLSLSQSLTFAEISPRHRNHSRSLILRTDYNICIVLFPTTRAVTRIIFIFIV